VAHTWDLYGGSDAGHSAPVLAEGYELAQVHGYHKFDCSVLCDRGKFFEAEK
jgi:hypothetical protein